GGSSAPPAADDGVASARRGRRACAAAPSRRVYLPPTNLGGAARVVLAVGRHERGVTTARQPTRGPEVHRCSRRAVGIGGRRPVRAVGVLYRDEDLPGGGSLHHLGL